MVARSKKQFDFMRIPRHPGFHHLTLRFNYGALVFSPVGDSWSTITLLNYVYSIQLSNENES